jgi:tetratricopeptide (TPR) repeat protein
MGETQREQAALQGATEALNNRVDALQLAVKRPIPWYKSVSTIISILALSFSFGTTYLSYKKETAENIHSLKAELRSILQRLAALPKDNFDLFQKYAHDPSGVNFLSGYINQENALLGRQAVEILSRLPTDRISATEYYAAAAALPNSYDIDGAQALLAKALQASNKFNDDVAILRQSAFLFFAAGRTGDGRIMYQRALNVFNRYPNYDAFTKLSTHIWTELSWATSEYTNGSVELANQHISSAENYLSTMASGPGKDMISGQVSQAKVRMNSPAPSRPAQLPNVPGPSFSVPANLPNVPQLSPQGRF